jgi:hypothetical protein
LKTTKLYKMKGPGKGKTNNPAGRRSGTPNKVTTELRQKITDLIEKNFKKIEADFNKLDPEKRLIVLERYLKYCLPPLQSLDIRADIKGSLEGMSDEQLNDLAEKILTLNSGNNEQG